MDGRLPRIARRTLLEAGAATLVLGACKKAASRAASKDGAAADQPAPAFANAMPRRPLGKTGETVSLIGIGGYHLGLAESDREATRIVRSALDRGVTFLDNCWDYHEGRSEERMGRALRDGYRKKAFLMTKVDGRTRKAAAEQLDQSLRRLETEMIDLVQVHEVIRMSDPARCFADDGCIRALEDAKKAGKLRFVGFTGHKDPDIHLAMLKTADDHGLAFDTVQMPLNVMDAHYRSFEKKVLPVLVAKKIGVLGMKSLASGRILKSNTVSAIECLQYAMNLPTSVVITGCESVSVLDQAIQAALSFQPLSSGAVARLLDRTRDAAEGGKFEPFKTTDVHDGTARHPQWLESPSI